jgi:DNA-binding transcriptional regulator LsrR (DeoR family)
MSQVCYFEQREECSGHEMIKSLLIRVAKMYYEQNMTQQEISNLLGTSRMAISRMLQKAKEEGVVDIKVNYDGAFIEMEDNLKEKYKLKEILVTPFDQGERLKQVLAEATASILMRILKDNDIVGVGWGSTLAYIPQYMERGKVDATFVTLIGGYGQKKIEMHGSYIASSMANSLNSKCHLLNAPAMVDSLELCETLLTDKNISSVLAIGRKANIAVIGIGAPFSPESTIFDSGYFKTKDIDELRKEGAECDIVSRVYLDGQGNECGFALTNRTIGITAAELKRIPLVIGVAGGEAKHRAIKLALQAGYVNGLVTDEKTAKFLLGLA